MQRIQFIFYALLSFILASCSSDDGTVVSDGETYSLSFSCDVQGYNDSGSRASAVSISSGAKMYVVLKSGSSVVNYGTATYSGGSWELVTNKTLSEGSGDAVLYYFENPKSTSTSSVTCSANTAVYSCTGSWSFSSNTLSVSGTLTPQMSRIRFYGSSSTSFSVSKVAVPSSFSISNGTLSTTESSQSVSISSSRYSDYVYADPSTLQNLVVTVSGTDYTKNALPSGDAIKSIVVDLPTSSSHAGWSVVGGADSEEPEYEPEPEVDYNGHEYVDLGLPSGLKWATMNVGASKSEDYGDYYAWGETETKSMYDWSTYKYMEDGYSSWVHVTKYTTEDNMKEGCWYDGDTYVGTTVDGVTYKNKTVFDPEDDAAHVNWGGDWRMPTKEEQDELRTKCTWKWGSQNGVNGYTVVGPNGNSLFLPAAGNRNGSNLYYVGGWGYFWSSSLYSYYAYYLNFGSSFVDSSNYYRYYGFAVRPVCQ